MPKSATQRVRQVAAIARDEGLASTIRRSAQATGKLVRDRGGVVWIHRPTDAEMYPPDTPMLEQTLVLPGTPEASAYDALRPITERTQELRLAAGAERWAFHTGDPCDPSFICWLYFDHAIVSEVLDVTLPLPPDSVQVEDAYVPYAKRGERWSLFAMATLCAMLRERDCHHLYSKVDDDNASALKALRADNWDEIANVNATVWMQRFVRWQVEPLTDHYEALTSLEWQPRGAGLGPASLHRPSESARAHARSQ